MSPQNNLEICHPAVKRISAWSRAAMLAFALAATPLLPAHAERDGHDGEDDRRAQDGTTLSIPLTGTGVRSSETPRDPAPKKATSSGDGKDTKPLKGNREAGTKEDRTKDSSSDDK
jgi:hypothetical protein